MAQIGNYFQSYTNQYGNTFNGSSDGYTMPAYQSILTKLTTAQGDTRRFTGGNAGNSGNYFSTYQQFKDYINQPDDPSSRAPSAAQMELFTSQYAGNYVEETGMTYYGLPDFALQQLGINQQISNGFAQEQEALRLQAQKEADDAYIADRKGTNTIDTETSSASRRGNRSAGVSVISDSQNLGNTTLLGA